MDWSKLTTLSPLLVVLGSLIIAGGAFLIYPPAGLIALGALLWLIAYMLEPAVRR